MVAARAPMPSELDRPSSPLVRPARSLLAALGSAAPALLWRALHPLARERFAHAVPPAPLDRIGVRTADRWALELRELPPRPGGAGEPVLLLPTLGASADLFRCGDGPTLAGRLSDAGFRVFLGAHRGTADAEPPQAGAVARFDDVAALDVPALLEGVAARSGYPRVHLLGHGLGGQAALAAVARGADAWLASLAVVATPVIFPRPPPALRRVAGVVEALPASWSLPSRRLARWGAVLVEPTGDGRSDRRRAGLSHAFEDVPLSMLAQVASWLEAGALCDRHGEQEHAAALAGVRAPLWLGLGAGDGLCPVAWALPLRDAWHSGPVEVHRWDEPLDHLDVVLHPRAGDLVHRPLVAWLDRQRVRAWREAGTAWGASRS